MRDESPAVGEAPKLPLTGKQRVHAALEGRPVDRCAVTASYNQLYYLDHYEELTGRPAWEREKWRYAPVEEHLRIYRALLDQAPFELLQPQGAPSRAARENTAFVEEAGRRLRVDRRTGEAHPIETVSGHASDYKANEVQRVFDRRDVDAKVKIESAAQILARGHNDYVDAAVAALGREHFILSGGVIGTIYSCGGYVGQTRLFEMLIVQPALIEYLCQKICEQNIEQIRALAAAQGDAIYIDDATATSDMISVKHYERFSLPYMQEMVREIHRLGHKALVIYFGGIADRLDQIAAIGADGLMMETTMKGYVNDIEEIAARIGSRVTLFGNVDPVRVLEEGTDAELAAEVERQARAAKKARGFVMCTGSPITPRTPVGRVRRFIELGRRG